MTHHEVFLQLALKQAQQRRGFCAPHPCVGAVAVVEGKVIAQAFHQGPGQAHAEVEVISKLPKGLKGVCLYVSLEPCNHWGKTPPCVKAIIDYGFSEVVFAYKDPHVHVPENDSSAILSAHGIKVSHCPLPQISAFYQSYGHWVKHKTPYVIAKWAQTFDGKVALDGHPFKITNPFADAFTHQQRCLADVMMTTAQTIQIDNPKLNVRLPNAEYSKPVAVLDRCLTLTGKEQFFECASEVHVFHQVGQSPSFSMPHVQFHAMDVTDEHLNLQSVLQCLGKLGYHELWLEAGPRLMASMHQQQLVQKTHILLAPKVLGEEGLNAYALDSCYFSTPFQFECRQLDDNVLTTFVWQDE